MTEAMNNALLDRINNGMEIGEDLNVPQLYGLLYQAAAPWASAFAITDLVLSVNGNTCRDKAVSAWNGKWSLNSESSVTYVISS